MANTAVPVHVYVNEETAAEHERKFGHLPITGINLNPPERQEFTNDLVANGFNIPDILGGRPHQLDNMTAHVHKDKVPVTLSMDEMLTKRERPNYTIIADVPDVTPNKSVKADKKNYSYPKDATLYDYIQYECKNYHTVKGREDHSAIFRLPMPAELNEQVEAGWAATDNWASKYGDLAVSAKEGAKDLLFRGDTAEAKKWLRSMKSEVVKQIGQEGLINKSLERSTGRIMNPVSEQFFTGMSHRTWEFVHKIVPETFKEAGEVNQLIDHFKLASSAAIPKGAHYHLLWPLLWDVKFMMPPGGTGSDTENPFLPKLNRCAVTQIQTNFTGAGTWARHVDGSPVEIDLTISLTELTIPTARNFVKNSGDRYAASKYGSEG